MKIPSIKGRKTGRKGIAIGTDKRIKSVPVVCNETGEVYSSIYSAAKSLDLQGPAISHHLQGKCKGALKGYTFKKCL